MVEGISAWEEVLEYRIVRDLVKKPHLLFGCCRVNSLLCASPYNHIPLMHVCECCIYTFAIFSVTSRFPLGKQELKIDVLLSYYKCT